MGVLTKISERRRRKAAHAQYERERQKAAEEGLVLCGTYLDDGTPVYYTVPPDADDLEIQTKAFTIRQGRPPSAGEGLLTAMAARRQRRG